MFVNCYNREMIKIKVMVFGTFDGVHKGHLDFFRQARRLTKNSYLIVSIARDKNVLKIKKRKTIHSEKERLALVKKTKLADKVILGSLNNYLTNILKEKPQIVALGYDQKVFVRDLRSEIKKRKIDLKIIRLKPYKQNIYKNSLLRKKI